MLGLRVPGLGFRVGVFDFRALGLRGPSYLSVELSTKGIRFLGLRWVLGFRLENLLVGIFAHRVYLFGILVLYCFGSSVLL